MQTREIVEIKKALLSFKKYCFLRTFRLPTGTYRVLEMSHHILEQKLGDYPFKFTPVMGETLSFFMTIEVREGETPLSAIHQKMEHLLRVHFSLHFDDYHFYVSYLYL